jgi:hypothetical protein
MGPRRLPYIATFRQTGGVYVPLTRIPGTAMWFGSVDVTSQLSQSTGTPVIIEVHSAYPPRFRCPYGDC